MLLKTHLAITLFSVLFLIDHVTYKLAFFLVAMVATILPDIDSGFSTIGKRAMFKPVQMMTDHRGIVHSFTLCLVATIFFSLYIPVFALPFFLGYALHLFADSFTIEGIRPFWPLKKESRGLLRVGSSVETVIFLSFCCVDFVLLISFFL